MPTIAARPLLRPGSGLPRRVAAWLAVLVVSGTLGVAMALGLRSNEIPGLELLAAGMALLGMLALAVARYELAVALGFALSAVVLIEPAPADAAFAVIICVALVTGRMNLRTTPLGPALGVSAFVALNLLACLAAIDPARALKFMAITIYLCAFALWLPSYVTNRKHARTLLRVYIAVAALSALAGTLALYLPIPGHELLTAYTGTRAKALFKDPNVFGPFLVPAALLLIQETLEPRLLRSGRLFKFVMLGSLVCGILFSFSRAAWMIFVVGVVLMATIFALRRGGASRALLFVGLMAVSGAVVIGSIQVTGSLGFLQERAHYQTYDNQRFGAQSGGIRIGERHPIGIGPGQFELVEPISAHSTYIRALAEEGWLGFLVLTLILYGTLGMALRNAVQGRDTHGIGSTALLAAWCGILANSTFVDTLHWRHLWLVAGLIWAARAAQTSSSAGTRLLR